MNFLYDRIYFLISIIKKWKFKYNLSSIRDALRGVLKSYSEYKLKNSCCNKLNI